MTVLGPLRLIWVQTWPEDTVYLEDWMAHPHPDNTSACRVFRDETSPVRHEQWRWVANGSAFLADGWEATGSLAAQACERAYFAAVEIGKAPPPDEEDK